MPVRSLLVRCLRIECLWLIRAVLVLAFAMNAVESSSADDRPERERRLDAMRQRAAALKLSRYEMGKLRGVERVEQPLMRYNDPARETTDGTVWAWGTEGRPSAVLFLFVEPGANGGQEWNYELTSLADARLLLKGPPDWSWRPEQADLRWREIANAPEPADGSSARLTQMKLLARRFKATETFEQDEFTLRLLPQPIHRYDDPHAGVIDGAIFTFAYGTNPEVLLLIEARRDESGGTQWYYGLARAAAARLSVWLDERGVWQVQGVQIWDETTPYFSAYGPE